MMTVPPAAAERVVSNTSAGEPLQVFLNGVGRTILHYINGTTFGLIALVALVVMVWYRRSRGISIRRNHAFRLVAGMLEIYLAVTLWTVFSLTHPPAFELLSNELLPYVGLVTLIVMVSSGLVSLRFAFSDNAKQIDQPPSELE
jgi:ABC-type xylose transport system permease subunit